MANLPPPGNPVFFPGLDTVTQWNTGIGSSATNGTQSGGVRDTLSFMANRPKFKARRAAAQTIASGHQYMIWDTIEQDNYGGGAVGSSIYTIKAAGWYMATARVSLLASAAGGTGLVIIPALAVNGASPTGIGPNGWEGPAVNMPTSAGMPKACAGTWEFYGVLGDQIQIDLWNSGEAPTITSTDTVAGWQPEVCLVWMSK